MKYTIFKSNADAGEYLVGHLISYNHKCIYRITPIDIGIDGEIEIVENEISTGQLIKVQVKTTDDLNFPGKKTIYSIQKAHIDYWNILSITVLLCRVFLKSQKVYCLLIDDKIKYTVSKNPDLLNIDFSSSFQITDGNFLSNIKSYSKIRNSNLTIVFKSINNLKQKVAQIPRHDSPELWGQSSYYLDQIDLIRDEISTIEHLIKGLGSIEQFPDLSSELSDIYRHITATERVLLSEF